MVYKSIAITIGLALVLIAVITAVPMIQQKVYAPGSPGAGGVGGSGSGNPFSGGNSVPSGIPGVGGFGGGSALSPFLNGGGPGTTGNIIGGCTLVSCGGTGTGFGGAGNGGQPGQPGEPGKTGTPGQPGQPGP